MEPHISNANSLLPFTLQLRAGTLHCQWLLDQWGGIQQSCAAQAMSSNLSSEWAGRTWQQLVDPSSDFQATSAYLRAVVQPLSDCSTLASFSASCIQAVAIDSFGVLHVATHTTSGGWHWSALNVGKNDHAWYHFSFLDSPALDLDGDGVLADSTEVPLMLGLVTSASKLFQLHVRPSSLLTPGLVDSGYVPSAFTFTARADPFPYADHLSLRTWMAGAVYSFSVTPTPPSSSGSLYPSSGSVARAFVYAVELGHELLYTSYQADKQHYSSWTALAGEVTAVLAYSFTPTRSLPQQWQQGFLAIQGGQLVCGESTNGQAINVSSISNVSLATVCVPSTSLNSSRHCTAKEARQWKEQAVQRLELIRDSQDGGGSGGGVQPVLVWVMSQDYAMLLSRPPSNTAVRQCDWRVLARLPLTSLQYLSAVQRASRQKADMPSTVAMQAVTVSGGSASSSSSGSAAGGTGSATPSAALISPDPNSYPVVYGFAGDPGVINDGVYVDVQGDGSQMDYGGTVQLSVTLTSANPDNGQIQKQFTVGPYVSNSTGLVTNTQKGTVQVYGNMQAIAWSTITSLYPQPASVTQSQAASLVSAFTASPTDLNQDAYNQLTMTLTDEGDALVQQIDSLVFQKQNAGLSSAILSNYNLTAYVLGPIIAMWPPSTYSSTILYNLINDNSVSIDVQTVAMQTAVFLYCPSPQLVTLAATLVSQSGTPESLLYAAASALSIWSNSQDCDATPAEAMGIAGSQLQTLQDAAVFWRNRTSNTRLHQLLHVSQPAPSQNSTGSTANSDSSSIHSAASMRATLLQSIAAAPTVEHASKITTLLGNSRHQNNTDYLLDVAMDEAQPHEVRYHALLALKNAEVTFDTVDGLLHVQREDEDSTLRYASLTSLAHMAPSSCAERMMHAATKELCYHLHLVRRHPLELKRLASFFQSRVRCAALDSDLASVCSRRVEHMLQSAYAMNGPYTNLTQAAHESYLSQMATSSGTANTQTSASVSSASLSSQAYGGLNNTLYFKKVNWGAEYVNLQFNTYAGYSFDSTGFVAEFFAASSVNLWDYNLQFAFADVGAYWSATGQIGLHSQFTVAWLDIHEFAYVKYNVYFLYVSFNPGVGVSRGDTCSLDAPEGGLVRQVTKEFIRLRWTYGIPYVAELAVTLAMGGGFGVRYGGLLTLPDTGNTPRVSDLLYSSVVGYVEPSVSMAASIEARISVALVGDGGVRGSLTVIRVGIPATVGYNINQHTLGSQLEISTRLLSGSVSCWWDTWLHSGSETIFSWPGLTYNYELYRYDMCYGPAETQSSEDASQPNSDPLDPGSNPGGSGSTDPPSGGYATVTNDWCVSNDCMLGNGGCWCNSYSVDCYSSGACYVPNGFAGDTCFCALRPSMTRRLLSVDGADSPAAARAGKSSDEEFGRAVRQLIAASREALASDSSMAWTSNVTVAALHPHGRRLLALEEACVLEPILCNSAASLSSMSLSFDRFRIIVQAACAYDSDGWAEDVTECTNWCLLNGGRNCPYALTGNVEPFDITGNFLRNLAGPFNPTLSWTLSTGTVSAPASSISLTDEGVLVYTPPSSSNAQAAQVKAAAAGTLQDWDTTPTAAPLSDVDLSAAATGGSAGQVLAHRAYSTYPYLRQLVQHHNTYLNSFIMNPPAGTPLELVFPDSGPIVLARLWTPRTVNSSSVGRRLLQLCNGAAPAEGIVCSDVNPPLIHWTYRCMTASKSQRKYPAVCHNLACDLVSYQQVLTVNNVNRAQAAQGIAQGMLWTPDLQDEHRVLNQLDPNPASRVPNLPTSTPSRQRDEHPPAAWSIGGCFARIESVYRKENSAHGSQMGGLINANIAALEKLAAAGQAGNNPPAALPVAPPLSISLGAYWSAQKWQGVPVAAATQSDCCKTDYRTVKTKTYNPSKPNAPVFDGLEFLEECSFLQPLTKEEVYTSC